MEKLEIENCLEEIISEIEFLDYKNPITYLIFLDRYSHMLNEIQIANTQEIIDKLKSEIDARTNIYLRKFQNVGE